MQPPFNFSQRRRIQSRLDQIFAERIDIVSCNGPVQKICLKQGRAAPHKRVIDKVTWPCQPLDEEPRQLRFETGAIADFVQIV